MEIGEYQKQTLHFKLVPGLGHDPSNGRILSLLSILERHYSMVAESMHSGSVTFWLGKLLIFSVPQFYSSLKGGIVTLPSGIDVVMCHTDPPVRLTHLFSQPQVCWLLTAHKESLPRITLNQRKLYCPRLGLPLGQPAPSVEYIEGTKTWPPCLDWTNLKGHPASDLTTKSLL